MPLAPNYPDFTIAGGPGRLGPGCQRVGRRTGLTICSRKVRAEETRRKEGQGGDGRELTGDRGGGQRGRGEQQQPQGSSEGRGEGTVELGRNRGEVHRQGRREDIDGCRAGAGMVGAGFRAGGRGGGGSCVEQRDRNVATRGTTRNGARGSRSEDQRDFLHRITALPPSSPPPISLILDAAAAQSLTYLGHVRWRPKLFLATAFLTLGRRRHVVLRCYTLEQHDPRIGQGAAVHGHGTHGFTSHQEPGSLISGGG